MKVWSVTSQELILKITSHILLFWYSAEVTDAHILGSALRALVYFGVDGFQCFKFSFCELSITWSFQCSINWWLVNHRKAENIPWKYLPVLWKCGCRNFQFDSFLFPLRKLASTGPSQTFLTKLIVIQFDIYFHPSVLTTYFYFTPSYSKWYRRGSISYLHFEYVNNHLVSLLRLAG